MSYYYHLTPKFGFDFNPQIVPMSLYLELIRAGIVKNPTYLNGK